MRAAVLRHQAPIASAPLQVDDVPEPTVGEHDLLVRVEACACCRTDLHVVEGDLPPSKLPLIPGHQAVGRVERIGPRVAQFAIGDRVGIAWLRHVDGTCKFCLDGKENLCPSARFTGYTHDGGYAELASVNASFAYPMNDLLPAAELAPLLCAGIIGYRALKRSGIQPGGRLGMVGFGNSAHINIQVARYWGCEIFVASRSARHQAMAREMGATWAGEAAEMPAGLDAAVIFAPAGALVPLTLRRLERGATLALAGIYMSDIPGIDYETELFGEKSLCSVTANTRSDGTELMRLADEIPIRSRVETYPLSEVNQALQAVKSDRVNGSAVVSIDNG